ncbi:ABC transporter permease [Thermodesulfobacteriota bacterium]
MTTFIIRRLLQTILVIFIVSFITFSLLHLTPGDPVIIMLGDDATQEQIDVLRKELGLDRPFIVQYGYWLADVLRGDLGKSIVYNENVTELMANRMPITAYLALISICLSTLIGISAGVISAVKRGSIHDSIITLIANIGVAIPVFWLGVVGIYVLGLKLGWLPIQGYTSPFADFWKSTRQLVMPVICLSIIDIAVLTRQSRSSMLEVLRQDYIRTALAKGLKGYVVVVKHALKNGLIPVVTLLGLRLRSLIGGSVLIETVFNIPGMGRLLVRGAFDKDFLIVQAGVLVTALVVCLANLIVDISYGWLDPRIRYD